MARPTGSYQKRTFLDTNLGRYIYLVEPIIFNILCPKNEIGFEPEIGMIIMLCNASLNPSFKNKRFESYIKEYVDNGLHVPRVKKITKEVKDHYEKIRSRRFLKKIKSIRKPNLFSGTKN